MSRTLIIALASCTRYGAVGAFHPRAAPAPGSTLPLTSTPTLQVQQQASVRNIVSRADSVSTPWQRHPASFAVAALTAASALVTLFPLGGLAIGASAALVLTAQADASWKDATPSERARSKDLHLTATRAPSWKRRPASFALAALMAASAVTTCFPLVGLGGASVALAVAHRG